MIKLNPYLNFSGNAQEAFNFYQSVFGGEFTQVVRFKDLPMEGVSLSSSDENKIMHIGLPIGEGNILMASDVLESMEQKVAFGNNVHLSLHPQDKSEADRLFQALKEGGKVEMELADQAWGDYYGGLTDKFGIYWMINYSPPKKTH